MREGRREPRQEALRLGVIVEKRRIGHPWQEWRWRAVGVFVDPPASPPWRVLVQEGETVRYHAANLELELFRDETEDYKYNLSSDRPAIYVILRESEDEAFPWRPVRVSASPWEGQAHEELSDDRVDAVPMPELVIARVKDFIDRFHVDRPFYKRKRKGRDRAPHEASEFVRLGPEEGS